MALITFKGKEVNTVNELPQLGVKAPDFTLVKQDLSEASLSEWKGKKKILNIVPSLDTDVCAASAIAFYEKLKDVDNVILLNISMDLPFAAKRFCEAKEIKTETLSAFRSSFGDDYGVKMVDGPLMGLLSRAVVIIDEKDEVIYIQQVPEITEEPNYDKAISYL